MNKPENIPTNAPTWLMDYRLNRSEIARNIGMNRQTMHHKMTGAKYNKFTPEQLERLDRERVRLVGVLSVSDAETGQH